MTPTWLFHIMGKFYFGPIEMSVGAVCRSTRYGSYIKAFEGSIVGNNKLVFASLSGHSQCDET